MKNEVFKKNRVIKIFLMGFFLCVVLSYPIFIYKILNHRHSERFKNVNLLRDKKGNFEFISPLLDSGYMSEEESLSIYKYEQQMHDLVQQKIAEHPEIKTTFYFNDLNNLSWFGINDDEKFIPASMLKVPMVISYYKLREDEPKLFEQKIIYTGTDYDRNQTIKPLKPIQPGNTYTVGELLEAMVTESDNNAVEALYSFKDDALEKIFSDLGVPWPEDRTKVSTEDFISVTDIARFFTVLYNASYLNKKDSEEVLKLLATTKYNDGITKLLPRNLLVSQKFGERILNEANKQVEEFHNCGIVYVENHPYEICIMTKGNNLQVQQNLVSELSKIIYDKIIELKDTSSQFKRRYLN